MTCVVSDIRTQTRRVLPLGTHANKTVGMPRRHRRTPPPAKGRSGAPSPVARSHVKADGTPKARYTSEREAADVAQLQWVEHKVELSTYQCQICQDWHLAREDR